MKNRVIKLTLTTAGVNNAIKEVVKYRKWLIERTQEFAKRLSDEGAEIASLRFMSAVYDGTNDVKVSVESRGENKSAVVAVGNSVLFIEFGSGIAYPDNHPEAAEHGMVRGEYGHKLGRRENGWRYTGDPGTNGEVITEGKHKGEVHTYGNPANMSMYFTVRELQERVAQIAKEVYGSD